MHSLEPRKCEGFTLPQLFAVVCRRRLLLALVAILLGATPSNDLRPALGETIAAITSKALYAHSSWGMLLVDQTSGTTLLERDSQKMFVAGSIMKTYSTSAALDGYGPAYRFHTPVYEVGAVHDGVLSGKLILVASGDFSFGLRERRDGTLAFNSFPEIDHNYADTGFPGAAVVRGSDPLAALNELATETRASGIRDVRGDVVVDDRLFAPYAAWPDGIISPMWINENFIDVTTTPGSAGQLANVDWRPKTSSVRVVSDVATVAAGTKTQPLVIETAGPGVLHVSGRIAADAKPVLSTSPITKPAEFARTAFIEALRRAGVSVETSVTDSNRSDLLPSSVSYARERKVAEHVSPPLAEFVKVVLKVSYNRGADDLVCLVAVRAGSRDCADGLAAEARIIASLGVDGRSTIVFDGAGSDDNGRTAPADQVALLRGILARHWGRFLLDGMAILGVDGTQATNQVGTPAAGHVRIKDGTRAVGSSSGQAYLPAKTQVGYIEAKSGRRLVYAVYVNNIPTVPDSILETLTTADHDIGSIVAAIQQAY